MLRLLEIYRCILFIRVTLTKKEISKVRTVFNAKFMRRTNILSLPKPCTTAYGLNSFTHTAAKFWNVLPDRLRAISCVNDFIEQFDNMN